MKQGIKSIEELYQNLEEQRENRKDIIADTRSLVVNSTDGISTLSVSSGDDILSVFSLFFQMLVQFVDAFNALFHDGSSFLS